jgi:hypothetical protein
MADKTLINPTGAHYDVADFRTYVDRAGRPLDVLEQAIQDCIASAAITRGDLVTITTPPDATTPPRVTRQAAATANTAGYLVYGVAMQDAVAGGRVQVCTRGLCFVNVGAGTPANTNYASLSTATAGLAVATAGAPAATVVIGEYLGRFLGAKDANNRAPLFFEHM